MLNPYNDSDWKKMIEEANQKIQKQKQLEKAPVVNPTEITKVVPAVMPKVIPAIVPGLSIPECHCQTNYLTEIPSNELTETREKSLIKYLVLALLVIIPFLPPL